MKRITVLLADGNRLVRRAYRDILEREDDLRVVGEAKNGRQAVAMVKELHPALVLMATVMPVLDGLHATRQILKSFPATNVLMLSSYSDDAYVEAAISAGAMGYLLKQTSAETVCPAIRQVHKGRSFFSPSIPRGLRKRRSGAVA
jgi:two-component system, NarL family, nitrate/nitrite response regulator NarL